MIRLVTVHQEFFLDDLSFLRDVGAGKFRVPVHVGEHVEQDVDVPVTGLRVVARGLFAGERVEIAADAFDRLADLLGATARCALEKQMLDEM